MKGPPHSPPSRGAGGDVCRRPRNVKAIGSSHSAKPIPASGASRPYGGIIRGKALGNAANIGDLELAEMTTDFVEVIVGSVDLFISKEAPTSLEAGRDSNILVQTPYEDTLAPFLKHVARCYSPLRSKSFKVIITINFFFFFSQSDHNQQVYIINQQKWEMKGRFNQALKYEESIGHLWKKTPAGFKMTLFLVCYQLFLWLELF